LSARDAILHAAMPTRRDLGRSTGHACGAGGDPVGSRIDANAGVRHRKRPDASATRARDHAQRGQHLRPRRVKEENPLYRDALFREFYDVPKQLEREVQATGSGVIVDSQRGYVLTANHVVEKISSAQVLD
jgi:S1-C subfamily serine protease